MLRERARVAYDALELPRWRRSGFWQTSFEDLDLDALRLLARHAPDPALPAILTGQRSAGVLVQRDASVVHVELDPELAARGVILCSLEAAASEHRELFERYYLRRLLLDRHKLEAASAAFWSGGAFLYVPPGLQIAEPFQIVYEISAGGSAQYAHTLAIGDRGCDLRLREYDLASGEIIGDALHAGQFELYLEDGARCRLAQLTDWGEGAVSDASTAVVEVGRDAYCHWLPALLGGRLIRHHDELVVAGQGGDMAFRGLFFSQARRAPRRLRGRPARDRAVWRRRPLARCRDRIEPGQLRGSDPDQSRRPADPHLPAVSLDDALRHRQARRDPLGAGQRR